MSVIRAFVLVLAVLLIRAGTSLAATAPEAAGFLVVAPDRGFLGNEETRDAFDAFAAGRRAALVFVTDERTRGSVETALGSLRQAGARRVIVLPFFLSRSDPRFTRVEPLVRPVAGTLPVTWGAPFGETYLAVEAAADRLRAIGDRAGRRVIFVAPSVADEGARETVAADLARLAEAAAAGLGFSSVAVAVPRSHDDLAARLAEAAKGGARPLVVPFHLGRKLDSMMSFTAATFASLPEGAELVSAEITPDPAVAMWMAREAHRHTAVADEEVGVVVLAHGSDHHWNETMWQAARPLSRRYKLEPAFSMADPPVLERAVRRLEARGARRIVILRVFGLADSFRADVERLIGLDVERGEAASIEAGHAHHHHHHGHGAVRPPAPRLRSSAWLTTVGGLDDHALFARALYERAKALSREPARETVVLVAHGAADDDQDARWNERLGSLSAQMRAHGGHAFRAIHGVTWREDWPEKRKAAVERARRLVQEASRDGGRAIVIPARTLGQGPERRLLDGLTFDLGEGFAPHPLFVRWAEEQVDAALRERPAAAVASRSVR